MPRVHGYLGCEHVQLRPRLDHAGRRRAAAPALPGRQRGGRADRSRDEGLLSGRADDRHRKGDRPDAFGRPEGHLSGRLGRTIEDRCDLRSSADCSGRCSSCALFNPGGTGPAASGQIPTCDGSGQSDGPERATDALRTPRRRLSAPAKRIFRGIELTGPQAVHQHPLGAGSRSCTPRSGVTTPAPSARRPARRTPASTPTSTTTSSSRTPTAISSSTGPSRPDSTPCTTRRSACRPECGFYVRSGPPDLADRLVQRRLRRSLSTSTTRGSDGRDCRPTTS